MNWMMAEPACDIRAQIDAMLDEKHPKKAVFAMPGNEADVPKCLALVSRREGMLVTADAALRKEFDRAMPDEAGMAAILGYPQPKDAAMAACPEPHLRVVQALDWRGNVITEALCSPAWLDRTLDALRPHGPLLVIGVAEALGRRIGLRAAETA